MMRGSAFVFASLLVVCTATARAIAAEPLPSFTVDLDRTSVSGLSSGAYMAGQFHIAFSETIVGVGVIAGGPYNCAEGSVATALSRCMETVLGAPDPAHLLQTAQGLAAQGRIDDLSGLAGDKVYVFSGTEDETVLQRVGETVPVFYREAGIPAADILYVDDLAAGHAMVTEDFGAACATTASPYINDCDYDQAGVILRHIYGSLAPPAATAAGRFLEFDQGEFLANPNAHSLGTVGYAYVPSTCQVGVSCRVHVVFHGCRQTPEDIGDRFVRHAGYNEWAEGNDIILLYPQAFAGPGNPRGCWDWWGYTGADYATKTGRQMAAVKAMLDRLAGREPPPDPTCESFSGSNYAHWLADRAEVCNFWFLCAVGSGERLGWAFATTTLYEAPKGTFSTTPCAR